MFVQSYILDSIENVERERRKKHKQEKEFVKRREMKENGSDDCTGPWLNRNQKIIALSRGEEIRLILKPLETLHLVQGEPCRPNTKGPYIIQGRSSGDESYVSVCGQKGSQFRDNGRIETWNAANSFCTGDEWTERCDGKFADTWARRKGTGCSSALSKP